MRFEEMSISQMLAAQHEMVLTALDLGLAGSDVTPRKGFRTREDALTTCNKLHQHILERRGLGVQLNVTPAEPERAAAEERTAGQNARGRVSALADKKITVLVKENPKREGTKGHAAFAQYKNGIKVSTFVERGGSLADVKWDMAHGYISLAD
jgi:hypothetical protein